MKKLALGTMLLCAGLTFGMGSQEPKDTMAKDGMMKSDAMTKDDSMMKSDAMTKDDSMMKSDAMKSDGMMKDDMMKDAMDPSAYNLQGLGPKLVAFTTEADAQKAAQTKRVVYFFAATWCPDCQATYRDLKANVATVPSDVQVVFVNYDKASELKKKYGITSQHTFVAVGPQGEKKKAWAGTTTASALVAALGM